MIPPWAFLMPEVPLTKIVTRGFVEECTKTAFEALVAAGGLIQIATGWLSSDDRYVRKYELLRNTWLLLGWVSARVVLKAKLPPFRRWVDQLYF